MPVKRGSVQVKIVSQRCDGLAAARAQLILDRLQSVLVNRKAAACGLTAARLAGL